ncbi:Trimeric GatFAB AmidoTransferase(AdT) complex subunit [Mycoemilia scoparia]|uniref:Glutamyl-tRNA(Gln) amidotransferase subunit A, mitochondrial n=1 Tax=Mycoemilia scoparia TaxID=417184 RepID=A0A9W7ZW64_9FUNG|nr:Trimeric GatFAB AmidoTransferase(AdT) complex subunit [Mycoemilia scoparia]
MLVGIKDNFSTHIGPDDAELTTYYQAPMNATVVSLIEDGGGTVVGKTNLDEYGMGSMTTFSIHGQTKMPQGVGESRIFTSPGGSSDTGGSVRLPAAWCGIVGFKPSYGQCSRYGLLAFASSLDTVGILSKTVEDARKVYRTISKPDQLDMTCLSENFRDEMARLIRQSGRQISAGSLPLDGIAIGIPQEYYVHELDDDIIRVWKETANNLAQLGAEIRPISLPHTKYALSVYYILAPAEASSNLARYDGVRYGKLAQTLDPKDCEVYKIAAKTRSENFGPEVQRRIFIGTHSLTAGTYEGYFLKAQKLRRLIQKDFDTAFNLPNLLATENNPGSAVYNKDGGVDAILMPTSVTAAPEIPTSPSSDLEAKNKDPTAAYVNDIMTVPASLAGLPAISIPAGLSSSNGLPLSLQLVGQFGDDDLVLDIARHIHNIYQSP